MFEIMNNSCKVGTKNAERVPNCLGKAAKRADGMRCLQGSINGSILWHIISNTGGMYTEKGSKLA